MSESEIHRSIVAWLALALPAGSVVHHSPNEGRHKVQYRVRQKQLGVRPGWPDLELFVPHTWWLAGAAWSPLFLEVKGKTGRVSPRQTAVHAELHETGCRVGVVRSIDDTADFLAPLVELRCGR